MIPESQIIIQFHIRSLQHFYFQLHQIKKGLKVKKLFRKPLARFSLNCFTFLKFIARYAYKKFKFIIICQFVMIQFFIRADELYQVIEFPSFISGFSGLFLELILDEFSSKDSSNQIRNSQIENTNFPCKIFENSQGTFKYYAMKFSKIFKSLLVLFFAKL